MDVNLNIEEKEVAFVKDFLKGKVNPVDMHDVAYRVALFKTRETRSHKVKIYNPNCEYKVGDLIYKEYPGKIPVGSKKYLEMDAGVVLKVVGVRTRFGINEVQLKYEGTSDFKKYTAYLERQKIELLLPHKQSKPCEKAVLLPEDSDPRQQQAPLEKREFNALSRKLAGMLNKDHDIALISNKVLLKENLKSLDNEVFDKIKEFLQESKKSETTEFFVENFARIRPDDESFDAYCFSLNYRMQIDYKIDFQQTQDQGWGKWNLISVIYYMKKDSPISVENPLAFNAHIANKKNLSHRRKRFNEELFPDGSFSTRYYLTQREVTAGAVKLKPGFFDLGESIEVELVDAKQKKTYLVYCYKDTNLMLGFKDIFERYKALQGTILTFEIAEGDEGDSAGKLLFNIRTTKKGTIADRVIYDEEKKAFNALEEKVASPVFVNKSIFLEPAIIRTLYERIAEFRAASSLNKLIHKIFLEFGIKERNYEIHILRLYHILDMIFPIDMKLVEEVILGNDEFVPAEKLAGVFYLDSSAVHVLEEEESKRKETRKDETKKKRDELRRKKIEQERRIKDEIRKKREERRKKREQEMWEKERLKKESEEKRAQESGLRKKRDAAPPPAPAPTPTIAKATHKKKDTSPPTPSGEELSEEARKKEALLKKAKKKKDEEVEKVTVKTPKRTDRKPDDSLSEDEIKSQIELEKLKDQMGQRKRKRVKKKEVAYKDESGTSGGVFAKLDELVKKEDKD